LRGDAGAGVAGGTVIDTVCGGLVVAEDAAATDEGV
jgi:hypothetical protein